MKRAWLIPLGLLLVLAVVNGLIVHKESVLRSGTRVFLPLAPVDPRSLIQGDYMRLEYAGVSEHWEDRKPDGFVIVRIDERDVGEIVRIDGSDSLEPGQIRIRYRTREGWIRVGSAAFFFQEGHASLYDAARYAELRVSSSGESVLVGLRDEGLHPLGPRR